MKKKIKFPDNYKKYVAFVVNANGQLMTGCFKWTNNKKTKAKFDEQTISRKVYLMDEKGQVE